MNTRVTIPGIELEGELGRGAYSVVYRAKQGHTPCAVKVPRKRGRWTRAVYREAVALARVHHPGLPAVFEVGEVDDLPYLVLELAAGETLADRLARGPLTEAEGIDLAVRIADTLSAVHDMGLVHRDIKPGNIVLESDGRVRVVDFGFAVPAERPADPAGTPKYAAPEQFRSPVRTDSRTDLYALGRVLAVALTGTLPEEGGSVVSALLAGGVSPALAHIVENLVALDPEDRYPNAGAVRAELEYVRSGLLPRGPIAYASPQRAGLPVGREPEFERLIRGWMDVKVKGASAVVVEGRRGSGKSRLLAAFSGKARALRGGRILEIASLEGDPPLAALRRLLEAYLAGLRRVSLSEQADAEDALRKATADHLGALARLIAPQLVDILGTPAGEVSAVPTSFQEGAAELIVRLARIAGPLLICIDDFQWTDPVSREALVCLAHRLREAPILLVVATRAKDAAVERLLSADRTRVSTFELAPLDEAKTAAIIAAHLGEHKVDAALVQRVATLADNTPLGVLEVLGAFLDVGALRPHAGGWRFDVERAERIVLPDGTRALLGRRLAELPPATRGVLEAAAILGTMFDEKLLARLMELSVLDLEFAIDDAERMGFIVTVERGRSRFVHDSLREMLQEDLSPAERRRLHQRAAELLDQPTFESAEQLFASVLHYQSGELEKSPVRAYRAARAAAEAALNRFDNEMALRFLEFARQAAPGELDTPFFRILGEAHLRLGELEASLTAFEDALSKARDQKTRATILGRIAWVYQTRADPDHAWNALERAFAETGARMPAESATSAAQVVGALAKGKLRSLARRLHSPAGHEREAIELLCSLHYQNARLGLEYGKVARPVQSTFGALAASDPLGPSRARARALAWYGFVLSAFGRRATGTTELANAQTMAAELGDPETVAFCIQISAVSAFWAGEFDRAFSLFRECLDRYGPWLELNEYCGNAASVEIMESIRGRSAQAWGWLSRAIDRLRRSPKTTTLFADYIIHRAHAAQISTGKNPHDDPWLTEQLQAVAKHDARGFYRMLAWGARARVFVEGGDVGPRFDKLVEEFEAEKRDEGYVHPVLVEYYIAVAHGRVQQCLRLERSKREGKPLALLEKALVDLRKTAKLPLFKAHRLLIEGYAAWFKKAPQKAQKLFSEAETLAQQETCPWVLYGVARGRAHMLREEGKVDAARDLARSAELFAREHGAIHRAQWVREEFNLPQLVNVAGAPASVSVSRSSTRARHQLASLLHIVRAPHRDSRPRDLASAVLSDLLRDLDAEHGLIWFRPDPTNEAHLLFRRNRSGEVRAGIDGWREALIRTVRERGEAWPSSGSDRLESHSGEMPDRQRVMAVPLFLYEQAVGALSVERAANQPAFTTDDRDLLVVLSHQVPIALEIARLLAEREELQTSLQQAQKMEAVGLLAGGVAHDFNNMLTAIEAATYAMSAPGSYGNRLAENIEIVSEATKHAKGLTQQLLTFSQHRPVPLAPVDVNQLIRQVEPMLRRLVGERCAVRLSLDPQLGLVSTVPMSFNQALVNLAINARDAMKDGGTLSIATSNVFLDESSAGRAALKPGQHVVVEVTDSGHGISPEVVARIFDPFFTTKPMGRGTGLGLTMVYAFVKNCAGHVEVTSRPEGGTTFKLYFPKSKDDQREVPAPVSPAPARVSTSAETILVVDDEPLVRESIRRVLEREGYQLLMASGADDALEIIRQRGDEIALVISDVVMPEVSGPELARQLSAMQMPAKLLFISGYAPESLPPAVGDISAERLLEKPFTGPELVNRVRRLLGGNGSPAGGGVRVLEVT